MFEIIFVCVYCVCVVCVGERLFLASSLQCGISRQCWIVERNWIRLQWILALDYLQSLQCIQVAWMRACMKESVREKTPEKEKRVADFRRSGFLYLCLLLFSSLMYNVRLSSSHLVSTVYLMHISCSMGCVFGWCQDQQSCWFHGFYQKLLCFLPLAPRCSAELTNRLRAFFILKAWEI